MRIDRAGIPFITVCILLAAPPLTLGRPIWAAAALALPVCMAFFFRDPHRHVPDTPDAVVAPADGRVLIAGRAAGPDSPQGDWLQIAIFLSPLDVHINRVPVGGRVVRIDHRPGRFLPAYRAEASANERMEIWIERGRHAIVVRQVVGVLARRVVCRLAEGQVVRTGERFGLMKFGSRMDVFLPPSADVRVRVGDRVRGGETILAVLDR
jgi:phosphatidylserine decarboxylase